MDTLKPFTKFYCTYIASLADSEDLDMTGETLQWGTCLDGIEKGAIDSVEDHGMTTYIFECIPIRKISRGKTKSIAIKPKK